MFQLGIRVVRGSRFHPIRTFYDHLWYIEPLIHVPLWYGAALRGVKLLTSSRFHFVCHVPMLTRGHGDVKLGGTSPCTTMYQWHKTIGVRVPMMGRTHALTGVAISVAATFYYTVPVSVGIMGSLICAGSALLPDIDHKESHITRTFGPVTQGLSWVMRKISGGHRFGTHSLMGIASIGVLAEYGVMYRDTIMAQIILCTFMILASSGAIRLLQIPGWFDDIIPIPIVIGIVCLTNVSLDFIPLALVSGCAIHVLGDMLTKSGCPLWWPFSLERVKLAGFTAGGWTERHVIVPLLVIGVLTAIVIKMVDAVM